MKKVSKKLDGLIGAVQSQKQAKKKGGEKQMKLQIGVPVSGLDLASLLEDEEGLVLCQNRGQNYITVTKRGHSITNGPLPVGRIVQEQPNSFLGPEPWVVTKISNSTEFSEVFGSPYRGSDRERTERRS